MADLGDDCAKDPRENMRVMVAGGDGTVGWVLGSLGQLYGESREPILPIGIIPLGTGNDLSRSFGWGGSFPLTWRTAVKRLLYKDGYIKGLLPETMTCFDGAFYNYFSIGALCC